MTSIHMQPRHWVYLAFAGAVIAALWGLFVVERYRQSWDALGAVQLPGLRHLELPGTITETGVAQLRTLPALRTLSVNYPYGDNPTRSETEGDGAIMEDSEATTPHS